MHYVRTERYCIINTKLPNELLLLRGPLDSTTTFHFSNKFFTNWTISFRMIPSITSHCCNFDATESNESNFK